MPITDCDTCRNSQEVRFADFLDSLLRESLFITEPEQFSFTLDNLILTREIFLKLKT